MLVLKELSQPDGVIENEDNVVAYWERDCLGQGTLFLTERCLIWIDPATKKGIDLPITSIVVHAASGASEDFPEPCLYFMVDYERADIEYVSPTEDVEDDEEEVKTAAMRLVPANASRISELFTILNTCQELNPEPDEQMSDSSYEDEGNEEDLSENHHNGSDNLDEHSAEVHEWFTADSRTDEIRLSAEGRANLERIVGSLSDAPEESSSQPHIKDDGKEEQMDQN